MPEGLRHHLARILEEGCSSGPDAELVADVLWMASVAGLEPAAPPAPRTGEPSSARPERPGDGRTEPPPARLTDTCETEEAELHPPAGDTAHGTKDGESGRSGVHLETPLLPLLTEGLPLAQSLRPLKQDVVRPGRPTLDEHGTAHAVGETGMLLPVWRQPTERRFSIDLVVDVGRTMAVWHRTGAELRALFERHGAFRDVRTWALDSDAHTPVFFPFRLGRARPDGKTGPGRRLRQLAGPSGRRLMIILTDGVGAVWRDEEFKTTLAERARRQPMAVLQVLPRRLWHRTALPTAAVSAKQNRRALPVPLFRCTAPLPGMAADAPDRDRITWLPVMEIRPNWLAPWAELLSGHSPGRTPMLATPLTVVKWPAAPPPGATPAEDPVEGVNNLRKGVSPGAFQLACYLAAAPLTLPIMQFVQRAMLPRSTTTELAEIFLSGAVRRVTPPSPGENPDEVLYDFHAGVREELLGCVTTQDSLTVLGDVLTKVSENVARVFGGASGFRSLAALASPNAGTTDRALPLPRESVPFARVALTVLESAGGVHGAAARRIRQSLALGRRPGPVEAAPPPGEPAPAAAPPAPDVPPGDTATGTALVVTGTAVEYEAMWRHLTDVRTLVHPSGTQLTCGALPGTGWTVALAEVGAGNQAPVAVIERAESWMRPDVLLFVGLAGSLTDHVALGDVIVATAVYAHQGVVSTPEGFRSRPSAWSAPHRLTSAARTALWSRRDIRVHFKPVAATDVVLNDSTSHLVRQLRGHYNDAVAVEMESTGISYVGATSLPALTIRGICDTADGRRIDDPAGVRRRAAHAAAEAAVATLRRLALPGVGMTASADPPAAARAEPEGEPAPPVLAGEHIDFRSGAFVGAVTGREDVRVGDVRVGESPRNAPASLPPAPPGFTGREDAMATLRSALAPTGQHGEAVVVTAVAGMGGVGKTALAVQAAHAARAEGWYPGGALFVDLRGYGDDPVTPDQAVAHLLEALGVRADDLPSTVPGRLSLYRTLLDRRTEPVLILADNASSAAQVSPLVPADERHRLVVVSRHRLPSLFARSLVLGELSAEASVTLLDKALRIADPSDERVVDAPADARSLAGLCGHLPLALQIAAARLAATPHMTVAELTDELSESIDRLDALDDGERDLRSVFDSSYRRLTPQQAHLLRVVAAAPGPDISTEALTALLGEDSPPFRVLAALESAHLVTRSGNRSRWGLHDLVRAYAQGVAAGEAQDEIEAARSRLLDFYAQWAEEADRRLRALPNEPLSVQFDSRSAALAWLDVERANLVAAVLWAAETRYAPVAIRLALAIAEYLNWRGYADDWIRVSECAISAARNSGDSYAEAMALGELGRALESGRRPDEAVSAAQRALDLLRALGDRGAEAGAWQNLGRALSSLRRHDMAIEAFTHARDLHRANGHPTGEGTAWNDLGLALAETGRVEEAIDAFTRARDSHQATGHRTGEGTAWHNLGLALAGTGRVGEAVQAHQATLTICRDLGDWYGAGQASGRLGEVYAGAGHLSRARDAWEEAVRAYDRADAQEEARRARERLRQLDGTG
ncbi:SAV_2336 N-terminal domain-related protein [Streptomyces echinatus]|uniref:Nucleoside phosphorylase/tetratricopeptide (TPR) repeat protein n=1 Tax=Streptomyces echinatus TaxID=67293 RepID=A0A7W9UUV8_9ACTN|nr:SAV_2336 N-terminal domain-related protein [Streptomyces echinatus]MBB5930989.1 nucleoside phosphorylase/tetratricopeptide (TPR) repeat protein [Streptomyces echinatus]